MDKRLWECTPEELSALIQEGDATSPQKAQPVLIAKTLLELQDSVNALKTEVHTASEASDRHADSMKWLTAGLVFVGIVQAVVAWVK